MYFERSSSFHRSLFAIVVYVEDQKRKHKSSESFLEMVLSIPGLLCVETRVLEAYLGRVTITMVSKKLRSETNTYSRDGHWYVVRT